MDTLRLRGSNSHLKVTSATLCLCLTLLGTGCVQQSVPIKADSSATDNSAPESSAAVNTVIDKPNPMFSASYSEEADVPFVTDSRQDAFKSESASRRTRDMADWILGSRDNQGMPFAIIDKVNAKAYAFDKDGRLYEAVPVLLGLAKGDYSTPGIGSKPLSQIPPSQRTTPAGRFVARMGRNHKGKAILWLDYQEALSLHAVVRGTPRDRRAQRLASPTHLDNRISFGCINVPKPFFKNVIHRKFSDTASVVYILPETRQFKKS